MREFGTRGKGGTAHDPGALRGSHTAPVEALRLDGLRKTYGTGDGAVRALDGVSLSLPAGTFTAIMGPSGSGKSTLLHCAAGLERPDEGTVTVDGETMTGTGEAALAVFRRRRIGIVFQQYNLLPMLTVAQNTALPLRLAGRKPARGQVRAALDRVGIGDRMDALPDDLSGGQRQRVALARAVVTDPGVILADEPTGALDLRSARTVLVLLREAVHLHGRTVVMVTHDPVAASHADAVVFLADGRLAGTLTHPDADTVAARLTHLGEPAGAEA